MLSHRSSVDSAASRDGSPIADFRASLVSFPSPPSFLPQAGPSRYSMLSNGQHSTQESESGTGSTSHGEAGMADRSGLMRDVSQRSVNGRFGGDVYGQSGRSSGMTMAMHRSRVSLDASGAHALAINTSSAPPVPSAAGLPMSYSTGSVTPTSTRSRGSSINRPRQRSIREEPCFVPQLDIPPRKQSRLSMPGISPVNATAGPSELRYHSAVTPDFEHMNPLERHIAMMATPAAHRRQTSWGMASTRSYASSSRAPSDTHNRPAQAERPPSALSHSRPISPAMSDYAGSDDVHVSSVTTASAPMPSLTDATLRMTPGVVGIGEGWSGGPQAKQGKSWWRRRRQKVEVDPLALWTVDEESPEKGKSPLKNAWNRSLVAIGFGGGGSGAGGEKRRASEGGSPNLRTRTYQRAKGLFSRSRLDLATKEDAQPSRLSMVQEEDEPEKRTPFTWLRSGTRANGLYSRSHDDLARFPAPPPRMDVGTPLSAHNLGQSHPGFYSKRYAASQPYLPTPRTSSLSNDPFVVPQGPAQSRGPRPVSSAIIEEDESQMASTPPVRPRGNFGMRRTSTFGNGADDITTELGFLDMEDQPRHSNVSSVDFRPESIEPIEPLSSKDFKRRSMFGRPLVGRLAAGFSSFKSLSRTTSPSVYDRRRQQSGSTAGKGLGVSVEPHSTQSSSPASSSLRTPIPEPIAIVPLAPEAPMPSGTSPSDTVKAPNWKQRSINASRSVLSLGLPIGKESNTGAKPRRLSFGRRVTPKNMVNGSRRQFSAIDVSSSQATWDDGVRRALPAEEKQKWRRSLGASMPALKRASLSDFSLLRFSFRGSEETFAGLFDIGRTPPLSRDEPNSEPVQAGSSRNAKAGSDAALTDTLNKLEGRSRPSSRARVTFMGDADDSEELQDQFLTMRPIPDTSPLRSLHPLSADKRRAAATRSLDSLPITPNRPSISPLRPYLTPRSGISQFSERSGASGSLRTLRPDADTPAAKRDLRAMDLDPAVATPPLSSSPPAAFAWASRPGMANRASSASSYHTASGFMAGHTGQGRDEAIVGDRERRVSADTVDSNSSLDKDLLSDTSEYNRLSKAKARMSG